MERVTIFYEQPLTTIMDVEAETSFLSASIQEYSISPVEVDMYETIEDEELHL